MLKTMTRSLGEEIEIISRDDDPKTYKTYGIYEDSHYSMQEGDVPVLVNTPSFIISNFDIEDFTDEYPLIRKNWKIRRVSEDTTYLITNFDRDESSSVRYLIAEEC